MIKNLILIFAVLIIQPQDQRLKKPLLVGKWEQLDHKTHDNKKYCYAFKTNGPYNKGLYYIGPCHTVKYSSKRYYTINDSNNTLSIHHFHHDQTVEFEIRTLSNSELVLYYKQPYPLADKTFKFKRYVKEEMK